MSMPSMRKRGGTSVLAAILIGLLCLPVVADKPGKKRAKGTQPPAKRRVTDAQAPAKKRAKGTQPPAKRRVKDAQTPAKRRVKGAQPPAKRRVKGDHVQPGKFRVAPADRTSPRRVRPRKSYVRTHRDYGHVRVTRRHRRDDGRIHIRPVLLRSARVRPVVLERFQERRRDQIRLIAEHFRAGRRARAVEAWRMFVSGLVEYHEPIDLDEVMLYVAREGCAYENGAFLFLAARLEYLRESSEQLEDYVDLLYEQHEDCERGKRPCATTTLRDIETALLRARADLEILAAKERLADDELETLVESSREYENRFAAVFEDMYREVEVRITFSP